MTDTQKRIMKHFYTLRIIPMILILTDLIGIFVLCSLWENDNISYAGCMIGTIGLFGFWFLQQKLFEIATDFYVDICCEFHVYPKELYETEFDDWDFSNDTFYDEDTFEEPIAPVSRPKIIDFDLYAMTNQPQQPKDHIELPPVYHHK